MVEISLAKKKKYMEVIADWHSRKMHTLLNIQQLYNKLLHTSLVVPAGCAYITSLETMLGVCSSCPFVPHHAIKHLNTNLSWWDTKLTLPFLGKCITHPTSFHDIHGFSDASLSIGIGIIIHGHWQAWILHPGWQTQNRQHDISWAECIGFELLMLTILDNLPTDAEQHFCLFCNNQGVINAWHNGHSHNWEINTMFHNI